MKKILSRIKIGIATLGVTLISFFSKVVGQTEWVNPTGEPMYGIQPAPTSNAYSITMVVRVVQILLITLVFIVGIVNFIKIRKIEDKVEKNKKIKRTVIVIAILIVILVAIFVISALLLGK